MLCIFDVSFCCSALITVNWGKGGLCTQTHNLQEEWKCQLLICSPHKADSKHLFHKLRRQPYHRTTCSYSINPKRSPTSTGTQTEHPGILLTWSALLLSLGLACTTFSHTIGHLSPCPGVLTEITDFRLMFYSLRADWLGLVNTKSSSTEKKKSVDKGFQINFL
jgi:hypothetical protein